jgi:hypothetical protein
VLDLLLSSLHGSDESRKEEEMRRRKRQGQVKKKREGQREGTLRRVVISAS